MTLRAGHRLGPYEVLAPLGAGGMGEVYWARDTRLERTVAVKVLPGDFASSPERRARFEREAKAISALNHPRICTLYDIGQQDGIDFLVMEYLEGETLSERLTRGALPIEQVLLLGAQVAEALAVAHRQGIIHRDLKPGNVVLTKSSAKVLDFGLARSMEGGLPERGVLDTESPTRSRYLTGDSVLLGTLPYMSPEQVEGKPADARSDIWSLGCVLFEMTTGKRAFEGKSQASLIAAILDKDPEPIAALQPLAPPSLNRLVRTCLAKDPDQRWQSAADLARELAWPEAGTVASIDSATSRRASPRRGRHIAPLLAATLVGIAIGIALARARPRIERPAANPTRFLLSAPEGNAFAGDVAISPQGHHIAFTATASGITSLWVRSLDRVEARRLPGTEGARFPFWSPDERFIAFFAEGTLKKAAIAGGPTEVLCQTSADPRGGAWSPDGVIIFTPDFTSGLQRIPASGGSPVALTTLDASRSERSHRWPQFLPDGRFLYLALTRTGPGVLYAGSLDGRMPVRALGIDAAGIYSQGFLLYGNNRTLLARPFDAQRLTFSGEAVPIAGDILYNRHADGLWYLSASPTGQLAYRTGTTFSELTWVDRAGRTLDVVAPGADFSAPRLSPDGSRLAVQRLDAQMRNSDVWLFDLRRKVGSRFTYDPSDDAEPIWSPDGSRVLFSASRAGRHNLYEKDADAAGAERLLLSSEQPGDAEAWSPDGRFVLHRRMHPTNGLDLMVSPAGGGDAAPFLATPFSEEMSDFAPNGQWVVYASDESGRYEVYVRRFEAPGSGSASIVSDAHQGRWQVSTNGGWTPKWSPDGKEIFYIAENGDLMAVSVHFAPQFSVRDPQRLFAAGVDLTAATREYDVAADGRRFLLNRRVEANRPSPLIVVLNWTADLKR